MGRGQSDYEDVQPLPVSTKEEFSEAAGLLGSTNNNSSSSSNGGGGGGGRKAFDVEFDVEDDELIDWQQHASSSSRSRVCCRLLSAHLPEWWWQLPKAQRQLLTWAAAAAGLICLTLLLAGAFLLLSGSSSSSNPLQTQQPESPAAATGPSKAPGSSGSSSSSGSGTYTRRPMLPADSPLCDWSQLQLPTDVTPISYKLHLTTDMALPFLVEGRVDIGLAAANATPCVVLHSLGINISSVKLLVASEDLEEPAEIPGRVLKVDTALQQVVLLFPEAVPLAPLAPVLQLQFSYALQEGLDGFYRSSFIDAANRTRVMASTQFESIAARKAFPCFDEPRHKAPFEIKISAPPPPYVVLSNMPLSHTHHGPPAAAPAAAPAAGGSSSNESVGLISYHFELSPPMPTYLVAFVIGELSHVETSCRLVLPPPGPSSHHEDDHEHGHEDDHEHGDDDGDGDAAGVDDGTRGGSRRIAVRVWGTSDRASQFGHAGDAACFALQTFERLLQVGFPLPKLDLVAIPNFAAGAMENWGLLTYRETALLVDDGVDDIQQRYDIATTVAHETAHQWFGDLVTLADWTELWLNEGFATYFEVVAADAFKPTWGYFDGFFADFTSPGLEYDGSPTSHPLSLQRPIKQLAEIDNFFDDVSYAKGGAVLRMLRAWLNQGRSPEMGFGSSGGSGSSSSNSSSDGGSLHQHMLHRRLLGLQAAAGRLLRQQQDQQSPQQQQQQAEDEQAMFVVPLPDEEEDVEVGREQQQQQPSAAAAAAGDLPASGSDSSSGGGSGKHWWLQKSHVGLPAIAGLQQQPAAAAAGSSSPVAAAPPAAAATAGGAAPAAAASAAPQQQQVTEVPGFDPSSSSSGPDIFLSGLQLYLQQRQFGSSTYSQLWRAMGEATGQPVEQMMQTWTLRRGFPILSVALGTSPTTNSSSNQVVSFGQVPYHAPRSFLVGLPFEPDMYCNDWSDDARDSSWWIPVPLRASGSDRVVWHSFTNCSSSLAMQVPHNGWLLANVGRYGFYRVNYSEPLWEAVAAAAAAPDSQIGAVDFAGLLDDAYSLSLVRQLNISVFLTLTKALGGRFAPELPPWSTALGWLQRMTDILANAALLDEAAGGGRWRTCDADLKRYVSDQLTGPFVAGLQVPGQKERGLTFEVNPGDSPELRLLRPKVLSSAGFLGLSAASSAAATLLQKIEAAGGAAAAGVSPDVTQAVYSLGVGSGEAAAYNRVRRLYERATDAADKQRALKALSRAPSRALIAQTLDWALGPAVRSQDFAGVLVGLARQGGTGFNMTWQFVIDRTDDIFAKYGGGDLTYTLGRRLNTLAKLFVDEGLLARLEALEATAPGLLSPTFLSEANEARITNNDWLRVQGADACKWLAMAAAAGSSSGSSSSGGGGGTAGPGGR